MISGYSIPHYFSADESQLYVSFTSGDSAAALNDLQLYLVSVQLSILTKKLQPNPHKTELQGTSGSRANTSLCFLLSVLMLTLTLLNLLGISGAMFDENFTFHSHISAAVCSSCFYHIRDLWHIRHYFDLDRAKLLAIAVSISFDYCIPLLSGTAD